MKYPMLKPLSLEEAKILFKQMAEMGIYWGGQLASEEIVDNLEAAHGITRVWYTMANSDCSSFSGHLGKPFSSNNMMLCNSRRHFVEHIKQMKRKCNG